MLEWFVHSMETAGLLASVALVFDLACAFRNHLDSLRCRRRFPFVKFV